MQQEQCPIYLNNAATSWPKPREVIDAVTKVLTECPIGGDRHGSGSSSDVVGIARKEIAQFFEAPDPKRLVFGGNASDLLNAIIHSNLKEGDHVVTTVAEHNSVLRPLFTLKERKGLEISLVTVDKDSYLDLEDLKHSIKGNTRMIVINHASNVTGAVQDIGSVIGIAKEKGIPVLLDASQSAGNVVISLKDTPVEYLVFTGHKSLYGPTGIGAAYISEGFDFPPFKQGGTGLLSDGLLQPDKVPIRYEVGTRNLLGIAGLLAGIRFIKQIGMDNIIEHKKTLIKRLLSGLGDIPQVRIFGPLTTENRVSTISFHLKDWAVDDIGFVLSNSFSILIRTGLHCAPLIHEAIGSHPHGTARMSMSYFNTEEEIDIAVNAIRGMVGKK